MKRWAEMTPRSGKSSAKGWKPAAECLDHEPPNQRPRPMRMNLGEVLEIKDLGNHPAVTVISFGILLAGTANVSRHASARRRGSARSVNPSWRSLGKSLRRTS
jgi:hypothetical protein